MLRPSPNHGTQRLPNDDDDDEVLHNLYCIVSVVQVFEELCEVLHNFYCIVSVVQVFEELCEVLHNATYDDSRLVMLTGSRGVFCSGIDLNFLTCGDPYVAARCMSDALRCVLIHRVACRIFSSLWCSGFT